MSHKEDPKALADARNVLKYGDPIHHGPALRDLIAWAEAQQAAPPAAAVQPEQISDERLRAMYHEDEFGLICDYEGFVEIVRHVEALQAPPAAAVPAPALGGELCGCGKPADYMANDGGLCCNKYGIRCKAQQPAAAVPASARGYVDDDRKRIVSAMQSMRDRLGGFLTKTYGDQLDGDIDLMLEAINFMKSVRIEQPVAAIERLAAQQFSELRAMQERAVYWVDPKYLTEVIEDGCATVSMHAERHYKDHVPLICAKHPATLALPARKSPPAPHTDDEECNCVQIAFADGWNACRAAMLAQQPAALAVPKSDPPVMELIGKYWDLGFTEGKTGVNQADAANELLCQIRLALAQQPAAAVPAANVAPMRQPRADLARLVESINAAVYANGDGLSVTEAIGALELAKLELLREQEQ